jgi:hypothetical protein
MKSLSTFCLALLFVLPLLAHAQAYKCKQANGSTSFQDFPCDQVGPTGRAMPAPTASPKPPAAQVPAQDAARREEEAAIRARNDEVAAYNKKVRCDNARRQLGILKEQRPVYSRDDKGERVYVDDKDRPAMIAAAEKQVAADCQ